jgi:2-octaprenyl-6-methoxyphenol hydroxylase
MRNVSAVANFHAWAPDRPRTVAKAGQMTNTRGDKIIAEVAVVGGGPAGLVCAIALASAGVDTAVIAPPRDLDNRTTALLAGSVTALATLKVWDRCLPYAAPLRKIRLVDDTSRLLRAPEVFFDAGEIGLDAFGHNIENRHLLAALEERAAELKIARIAAAALVVKSDETGVTIEHDGGAVRVSLVIGADGVHSLCRMAAGIGSYRRAYPQTALTLNLAHEREHEGVSTELHTESGPFTLVPLPGLRSSLVCVLDPKTAQTLSAMTDTALAEDIERRAHSLLGRMRVEPGRGLFPLTVESADSGARARIVLVGEAAHVLPPIGAQGLNLGLRDSAAIAEIVADARRQGLDVGAPDVLARYNAQRRADVMSRTVAVDILNRSLLAAFLPAQGLRGLSLYLLGWVDPLRRALMREGVAPAASQPRLMRGEMV